MGRIFARGQLLDSILHVRGLVGRLPRVPCLCSRVQIFPLVRGSRVRACFQHCVCRDHGRDPPPHRDKHDVEKRRATANHGQVGRFGRGCTNMKCVEGGLQDRRHEG